jgi:hypothetical protein
MRPVTEVDAIVQVVASTDVVERVVAAASGNTYQIYDYFGSEAESPGPQGFLVHFRTPGGVIKPHYHPVDQFQVVVRGNGRIGRHPLFQFMQDGDWQALLHVREDAEPSAEDQLQVAVQYADGYTPYGPIVAGDSGIGFFTIRATPDHTPSNYMPESREKMNPHRAGRSMARVMDARPVADEGNVLREVLIEPHPDGLAAFGARARAGAAFRAAEAPGELGQYYLLVRGNVILGRSRLPRESCLWLSPHDDVPELVAGPDGAAVLVLQFPRRER